MKKHKFISQLESQGAKVTEITYRFKNFTKKGFDIEMNGKLITIEPINRRLGVEYFVCYGNGTTGHYTKRSKEGFLPILCQDLAAFKKDIQAHFNN